MLTPDHVLGPVLETERLRLRPPAASDWPQWLAFAGTARARFIGGPMEVGRAWRAFGHAIGHWTLRGFGSFAITLRGSDTAIGMCGPWHPADWPEREIGWTIWDPAHEGRGIAREAARRARAHAFDDLGWETAVSYIMPGNARSIALAERLGAVRDNRALRPDPEDLVYRHLPERAAP